MAKADLDADAAKAIFARAPPLGLSVHVSHNGSYVKEIIFLLKKYRTRALPSLRDSTRRHILPIAGQRNGDDV